MRKDDEARGANQDDEELEDQDESYENDDDDEDDDEMDDQDENTGRSGVAGFAVGIAIGALVGAAAALLLAPASGRITRRRLRTGVEEVKDRAQDEWDHLSRKARRELKRRLSTES